MSPELIKAAEEIANEWLLSLYLVAIGGLAIGFAFGYLFRRESEKK